MDIELPLIQTGAASVALPADGRDESGSQAPARLIEYAPGRHAALPPHTTLELIERPAFVAVPGAAAHAYGLLAWQGRWLPSVDIEALVEMPSGAQPRLAPCYALVLAYQRFPRWPVEHGAIGLAALPKTVMVSNAAQCELPTDSSQWLRFALSCFRHGGRAVPILDTAKLFGYRKTCAPG